jgi:aromatic ring-opening dioxygenase catalytic subunit (LigB family)
MAIPEEHSGIILRSCIQKFPDWVDKEINNNWINMRKEKVVRYLDGRNWNLLKVPEENHETPQWTITGLWVDIRMPVESNTMQERNSSIRSVTGGRTKR